jgi:hypothetical protein
MSATVDFLREAGLGLSEREFVDLLRSAVRDAQAEARAPLTPSAAAYVTERGGVSFGAAKMAASSTRTVSDWGRVIVSSRTIAQVAAMIGRDPSRVRHMIADGTLHALAVGRTRLVPDWQFAAGAAIPGLRETLAALPVDLHPLELEGWMTTA